MTDLLADITPLEWERVQANLGLIGACLRTYNVPAHDVDEAEADAVFGLARAVQLHDPEKGALSTIAYHHIRQSAARGRGVREGKNVRRAQRMGTMDTYEAPYSLDAELSHLDGSSTLLDLLHDDSDPAHEAEVRLELDAALSRMAESVRDDLDAALLEEVIDTCSIDFNLSAFARRNPTMTRECVRRRLRRLVQAGAAA